jgi:hypothetical protein
VGNCRKLHNKELHVVCSSTNAYRLLWKSRRQEATILEGSINKGLEEYDEVVWIGLFRLTKRTSGKI